MGRGHLGERLRVGGQELSEGVTGLNDGVGNEAVLLRLVRDVDGEVGVLLTALHGIPPGVFLWLV